MKDQKYSRLKSAVKWVSSVTDSFMVHQGVRQGGIASTTDYKKYINDLLDCLETNQIGFSIVSIYCGAPACADDILIIATSAVGLQIMVGIANSFAEKELYILHPAQSGVLVHNSKVAHKAWQDAQLWKIHGSTMPVVQQTTHPGTIRSTGTTRGPSSNITAKIALAGRTCYFLMEVGFHGLNGIAPPVAYKLYITYVARLLLGAPPAEASLDLRRLSLFGSVARRTESTINDLAHHQLVMKSTTSKNVFYMITRLLYKYQLPPPLEILQECSTKEALKKQTREAVYAFWLKRLKSELLTKSSLRYVKIENSNFGTPHV